MKQAEREDIMIRSIQRGLIVSVQDMVAVTGASEATIRRDLDRLEKQGALQRTCGGAKLPEGVASPSGPTWRREPSFASRQEIMDEKKRLIAKCAVNLCLDGETIMIDGGTTTYHLVDFLRGAQLQVITNSFPLAETLIPTRNRIILLGGVLDQESLLVLDPEPEKVISRYFAAKLFMGIAGIDENGFTNNDLPVIQSERIMLEQAGEVIVLADSSKFGKRGALRLCEFERVNTVITDAGITEEYRQMLTDHGIRIIIAD